MFVDVMRLKKMEYYVVCSFDYEKESVVSVPAAVQANPKDFSVAMISCNLMFSKTSVYKAVGVLLSGIDRTTFVDGRWEPVLAVMHPPISRGRLLERRENPQFHPLLAATNLTATIFPETATGSILLKFRKLGF